MKCSSQLVINMENPPIHIIFAVEEICSLLVKMFPLLPNQYHGFAVNAVIQVPPH